MGQLPFVCLFFLVCAVFVEGENCEANNCFSCVATSDCLWANLVSPSGHVCIQKVRNNPHLVKTTYRSERQCKMLEKHMKKLPLPFRPIPVTTTTTTERPVMDMMIISSPPPFVYVSETMDTTMATTSTTTPSLFIPSPADGTALPFIPSTTVDYEMAKDVLTKIEPVKKEPLIPVTTTIEAEPTNEELTIKLDKELHNETIDKEAAVTPSTIFEITDHDMTTPLPFIPFDVSMASAESIGPIPIQNPMVDANVTFPLLPFETKLTLWTPSETLSCNMDTTDNGMDVKVKLSLCRTLQLTMDAVVKFPADHPYLPYLIANPMMGNMQECVMLKYQKKHC